MSNGGLQRHPSGGRADGRQRVAKPAQPGESLRCRTRHCRRSGRPRPAARRRTNSNGERAGAHATDACTGTEDAMLKKQLPPDAPLARRTLLMGATLGVGAGLVSTLTATYCGTQCAISSLRRQRSRAARRAEAQNQRAPGNPRGSSRQLDRSRSRSFEPPIAPKR
jgi:hypothetical protein